MGYSRAWSNVTPLGSAPANTIDDEIRNLRQDVQERMDTILGAGKWATDPVATLTALKKFVPYSSGKLDTQNLVAGIYTPDAMNFTIVATGNGNAKYFMPIELFPGYTLINVKCYVYISGPAGGSVLMKLSKHDITTAITSVNIVTTGAFNINNSINIVDSGAIAEVIADAYGYYAEIDATYTTAGTGIQIKGLELTYNRPHLVA